MSVVLRLEPKKLPDDPNEGGKDTVLKVIQTNAWRLMQLEFRMKKAGVIE